MKMESFSNLRVLEIFLTSPPSTLSWATREGSNCSSYVVEEPQCLQDGEIHQKMGKNGKIVLSLGTFVRKQTCKVAFSSALAQVAEAEEEHHTVLCTSAPSHH